MYSAAIFIACFLVCSSLGVPKGLFEHQNSVYQQYFPSNLKKADVVVPPYLKMLGLTWSNCGPATDPLKVVNITLTPDPPHLPGTLQVGFAVNITRTIISPLKIALKVSRKVVGVWVEIPCVDNFGSCNYPDGCTMIKTCPDIFVQHNIPCTCPVAPGQYYLPPSNVTVSANLPSWLSSGTYQANADFSDASGHVGCLYAMIDLAY